MGHGPCGLEADKASDCRTTVIRWGSTLQVGKRPLILDFRTARTEGGAMALNVHATESDRNQRFQARPRPSVGPIQRSNVAGLRRSASLRYPPDTP